MNRIKLATTLNNAGYNTPGYEMTQTTMPSKHGIVTLPRH